MKIEADDIVRWIHDNCLNRTSEHELSANTALLDEGLIDSMEIMLLVSFLEEESGLTVPLEEVVPENFETPGAVTEMMARLSRTTATR